MSAGKSIAQAGHAYLESYLDAILTNPDVATAYSSLKPGTKIALEGGNALSLQVLHDTCRDLFVPCRLVVDQGHVELPDFDGSPIITALGVGPIGRQDARRLLGHLPLWRRKGGGS